MIAPNSCQSSGTPTNMLVQQKESCCKINKTCYQGVPMSYAARIIIVQEESKNTHNCTTDAVSAHLI